MRIIKKDNKTRDIPKKENLVYEIYSPVRIPGTPYILQKGERIEVIKEQMSQSVTASNECASGSFDIFEDDEGNQTVSGSITVYECSTSSKISADMVKKALDTVVSTLKLQVETPTSDIGMEDINLEDEM